MKYRTLWIARHVMPDDRPAYVKVDAEPDEGLISVAIRRRCIHPALVRSVGIFSEAFAQAGPFEMDPGHESQPPELQAWFEAADGRFTDDEPMRMYFGGRGPWFFEILVRDDLVDEAVIRELNETVMPTACGLLVPLRATALCAPASVLVPGPHGVLARGAVLRDQLARDDGLDVDDGVGVTDVEAAVGVVGVAGLRAAADAEPVRLQDPQAGRARVWPEPLTPHAASAGSSMPWRRSSWAS